MKFIGQYIQDLIARFRNDVYLEDVSTGTIASGGNLGLDSNNKIVKANEPTSHDAVTLAGALDYITLSGQEITRNAIDLANDVTGTLGVTKGGTGLTSISTLLNSNVTSVSGNAGTATRLATERDLQVDLSESNASGFDGSQNISDIGVGTSVLGVANGGTGLTSISTLLNSNVTSVSGNAGTATALATARNIAGVSFDGTANISLNNNAITNGAGYTTNTGDIDRVRISTSSGNAEVTSGNADFTLSGTSPIGVTNSGTTITVAANDASTSAKGVASFSSDNFAASSGAISIKAGGVDLTDEVTGTLPAGNGGTGVTDVKQIITRQAFQCNFIDDIGTTKHYLPLAGIQENTVRYQDEAAMLAPCDGRVASVTLKMENLGGASGDITFGVEVAENPGTGYAQTWTTVETETFTIASSHNHDTFHFHFTQSTAGANNGTSKHFDATMMWAISIQSDDASLGGDGSNDERWFVTAVVEWDWSTYLGTEGTTTRYTSVP
jgi:hypothetical protein